MPRRMTVPRSSADALVVGAGVVGLAIALDLRARGAEAVVLERKGVAEGQSGIQPGGGFMIAPAVGRIVAGAVVGDDDTVLAILDSRRFQEGRTVPEPQVI